MTTLEKTLKGKKVLIVDDDSRNIFALATYLESMGLDISTVDNGYGALDILLSDNRVGLVLLDMMMPGIDGFETLEKIRGNTELSSIPVISVTAKAMKGDREKCLEAGANEYVAKPVVLDELIKKMLQVLS